jgi:hypothetical protein
MPGLSIANVRLSMRLIEASVQAARASIANNKKQRIFGLKQKPIDAP